IGECAAESEHQVLLISINASSADAQYCAALFRISVLVTGGMSGLLILVAFPLFGAAAKVATVLCAVMVLVFSSEASTAQQGGVPAERHYSPPERYAREHCRPEPYTSDSLVGYRPTREEYMGFPPWASWKKIPSIAVVSIENDPRLRAVREAVYLW